MENLMQLKNNLEVYGFEYYKDRDEDPNYVRLIHTDSDERLWVEYHPEDKVYTIWDFEFKSLPEVLGFLKEVNDDLMMDGDEFTKFFCIY